MRAAALATVVLLISACGQSPMGSTDHAAPPADAPALVEPDYSGDFDALGTEPFWSVKIHANRLTLSRPGHPDQAATDATLKTEGQDGVFDARIDGRRLILRLTPGDCSDGMSDRRYDYLAEVRIDDEILKGCASRPRDLKAQTRP
ncbi:COG3650 family protein [Caulobacter sp. BP25]|uniref:COG3650 family protein n=1 Tax=Caulobacter sp. BP25 TaxID=2048900 RepID=UPI000C12C004|nr:hypothetical protein [Caulobacter sp. BP25]PHY19151.1 hypothetical protein CSW59_12160 [Caulobacter sp. BP25]